jgi:Flp pilus assembly protein TadG
MFGWSSRLAADHRGVAAVEFAIMLPLFLILFAGSVEVARALIQANAIEKALRAAAYYAGRSPLPLSADDEATVENLVKTGTADGSGALLVPGWADAGASAISRSHVPMNRCTSDRQAAGSRLVAFGTARSGATALEFALVLPLLVFLSLGTLETMLLFYDFHKAGEMTRRATRAFLIDLPVNTLDSLPTTCPEDTAVCDFDKIDAVVDQLKALVPTLTRDNLRITVSDSGLDTGGPGTLVTPIISVSVTGLTYSFGVLGSLVPGLSASIDYPPFETSRVAGTMVR